MQRTQPNEREKRDHRHEQVDQPKLRVAQSLGDDIISSKTVKDLHDAGDIEGGDGEDEHAPNQNKVMQG